MPRDARTLLQDMLEATTYLLEEAPLSNFEAYTEDTTVRLAVERSFITLGEAMSVLRRHHIAVFDRFADSPQIVAFRNFLVHVYWSVDPDEIRAALQTKSIHCGSSS